MSTKTKAISLRLDQDVLSWFKNKPNYQSHIKKVLKEYVSDQQNKRSFNLGRAQEIYKQMHARCFWHYHPNLIIDEENFLLVIDGLRKYGGKEGFILAEELCQ